MGSFKITKVIMKSLFKKPATLMYPVVPREWTERTRGHIDIACDDCVACGICAKKCPTNAITVDKANGTWTIERMQCIQCGSCAENCPKKCLSMAPEYTTPGTEKVVDTFEIKKSAAGASAGADGDGALQCNADTCVYCGLCAKACPADAIKVDRKAKSWEVDTDACLQCGACVDKCPKGSLSFGGEAAADEAPAAAVEEAPVIEEINYVGDTKVLCKIDDCVFCGVCGESCPVGAIEVEGDSWKIDDAKCVECETCTGECPQDALVMALDAVAPKHPVRKPELKGADKIYYDKDGIACDKDACIYCGICAKNCPMGAIEVDRKAKDWDIDHSICMDCGLCIDKCPKDALAFGENAAAPCACGEAVDASAYVGGDKVNCKVEDCVFCGVCADACPVEAITVDGDKWEINDKCVECETCIEECPQDALIMGNGILGWTKNVKSRGEVAMEDKPFYDPEGLKNDLDACIFCGACADNCPMGAIEVSDDKWTVDHNICMDCGICVGNCPVESLKL